MIVDVTVKWIYTATHNYHDNKIQISGDFTGASRLLLYWKLMSLLKKICLPITYHPPYINRLHTTRRKMYFIITGMYISLH